MTWARSPPERAVAGRNDEDLGRSWVVQLYLLFDTPSHFPNFRHFCAFLDPRSPQIPCSGVRHASLDPPIRVHYVYVHRYRLDGRSMKADWSAFNVSCFSLHRAMRSYSPTWLSFEFYVLAFESDCIKVAEQCLLHRKGQVFYFSPPHSIIAPTTNANPHSSQSGTRSGSKWRPFAGSRKQFLGRKRVPE